VAQEAVDDVPEPEPDDPVEPVEDVLDELEEPDVVGALEEVESEEDVAASFFFSPEPPAPGVAALLAPARESVL
jgi:hypothetical protein